MADFGTTLGFAAFTAVCPALDASSEALRAGVATAVQNISVSAVSETKAPIINLTPDGDKLIKALLIFVARNVILPAGIHMIDRNFVNELTHDIPTVVTCRTLFRAFTYYRTGDRPLSSTFEQSKDGNFAVFWT